MSEAEVSTSDTKSKGGPPRIFVSYTHESPDHKRWVGSFARDLSGNGVDVILDQWDLPLGADVTLFMEEGIRTADRVLLVCTPTYKQKAEEAKGGVGYERLVITAQIAQKLATTKFVSVLRGGEAASSIPIFIQTRRFVDFRDSASYAVALEELLRDLLGAPREPRPLVGSNPFADGGPIVIGTPAVPAVSTESVDDAEVTYSRAEKLLRAHDLLGWNRFARATLGRFYANLADWRSAAESRRGDQWDESLAAAIGLTAPLMTLALAAVDSEIAGVTDQRALIQDLTRLPAWNMAGYTRITSIGSALGLVYHHVLGALLISKRRVREATDVLTLRVAVHDGSSTVPVWSSKDLMGWVDALGGNCKVSWKTLAELFGKHGWLHHFFRDVRSYHLGLRGYNLVASLLELGDYLARGQDPEKLSKEQMRLDVPPMFLYQSESEGRIADVVVRTLPDRTALSHVVAGSGVSTEALRGAWGRWFRQLAQWDSDRWFRGGLPDQAPELP